MAATMDSVSMAIRSHNGGRIAEVLLNGVKDFLINYRGPSFDFTF